MVIVAVVVCVNNVVVWNSYVICVACDFIVFYYLGCCAYGAGTAGFGVYCVVCM